MVCRFQTLINSGWCGPDGFFPCSSCTNKIFRGKAHWTTCAYVGICLNCGKETMTLMQWAWKVVPLSNHELIALEIKA